MPRGAARYTSASQAEFVPPERIVNTELMDGFPSESVVMTMLVEKGGKTTLTTTIRYASREIHDQMLKSGMERGVAASYDRLADLLAAGAQGASSQVGA